jgi:hypothetical protein
MVVSFHELAERELNDAAQYYDLEQPGLGATFIADVRHCTASNTQRLGLSFVAKCDVACA